MGQLTSRRRASAICTALFFIGLAIVFFIGSWWPGIMLAIGIPLALRQFLLGRLFDMCISLFIFGGIFVTEQFDIDWKTLLPVMFILAAVYILIREFQENKEHPEDIEDEDVNHEIEESQKK
jgi:predicted membrane protein